MARLDNDRELRELVRKNVGRLQAPVLLLEPPVTDGRFGTLFRAGELIGGPTPGVTGALPGTPGVPAPTPTPGTPVPEGRIIGVALSVANATREVGVSITLPAPSILRALTIHGNHTMAEAASFRVLLAEDTDTTAVANPTGTDLIEFGGDVIGAEDAGVHANLAAGSLSVEPWRRILTAGTHLKLKFHNLSGGIRNIAAYADLDLIL